MQGNILTCLHCKHMKIKYLRHRNHGQRCNSYVCAEPSRGSPVVVTTLFSFVVPWCTGLQDRPPHLVTKKDPWFIVILFQMED
jgi:hypothetical protein